MSQKQMTSSMAVAGAVMGAVLALFLIIIFTIVLLTARKVPPHTHTDKVIDLPPTHRPPPPYSERPPAVPQDPHTVASFSQSINTRVYECKTVGERFKDDVMMFLVKDEKQLLFVLTYPLIVFPPFGSKKPQTPEMLAR
ncbi:hypothetical protein KOW79_015430 [Hemibagrus wyckioides]|uniref:Uncharacterized protein n=1 Tax=Hemibagrus wyckioides TaxID=337641 RepID=A0A9D3NHB8_9TELE|nr:hypothetical protein KOW79_015430 [Hemibagrus wyckioides]